MASFEDGIRDLLNASGRNFSERREDGVTVFSEDGRSFGVFAVPVSARTPEGAMERMLAVRRMADAVSDSVVIAEDRWLCGGAVTRARLNARIGLCDRVFARNCEVRRIDGAVAGKFLEGNHAYGDAACRYRYGLFVRNESGGGERRPGRGTLVAVAGFSNARRLHVGGDTVASYEWIRYASLPWMRVAGGMGKLLNAFVRDVRPDDVMSYADLEWSDGEAYRRLGFVAEGDRAPVLFAVDPHTYRRTAAGKSGGAELPDGCLFFMNMGSRKYRLRTSGR